MLDEIIIPAFTYILSFVKITGFFSKVILPAPPPMICAFSETTSNKFSKKLLIFRLRPSNKTKNDSLFSKKEGLSLKLFIKNLQV